jgi:hypothetical protein
MANEIRELIAMIRAKLDAGMIRNQDLAHRTIVAFQWLLDECQKQQALRERLRCLK